MRNRTLIPLVGLAAAGLGLYLSRRYFIARALKLRVANHAVGVRRNIRIPMRDGVGLMADHYYPKSGGRLPAVLIRSIYGRGSDVGGLLKLWGDFVGARFAERGYHLIVQTTRGRFDSEGETRPFVDAAPDGQATLDWIAAQPWFDGNLGMWGGSYLGYVQWAVAADAPPYLKALAPTATTSQFRSVILRDGAFSLDLFLRWMYIVETTNGSSRRSALRTLQQLNPSLIRRQLAPAFTHLPILEADVLAVGRPVSYYRDWLEYPPVYDIRWQSADHSASLSRVNVPAHLTSGWYDIFLPELLNDYARLRAAGYGPYLTIGPWAHTDFPLAFTSLREGLIWFDSYLKGDRRQLRDKPVRVCIMGVNEWREMDQWPPPAQEVRYFLQSGQGLAPGGPAPDSPPDHYRYNPADPTPALGGALILPPYGALDNRPLESRADVLCFTTPPLEQALELIGPVRLELFVRSSVHHTDFFGRVCDVHPDGRSINVCDGLFRLAPGKGEQQPDGSLRIEVDLWATAHRFRRRHRLRLQVSSGAHPRWSRNLGTGDPLGNGTDMVTAEQMIYHDSAHPSALVLPVTN